jgi:hypothetical protein
MLRELTATATVLVSLAVTVSAQNKGTIYGEGYQAKAFVPLESAVTKKVKAASTIQGKVMDVCSKKGCWMIISSGNVTARVTFKDYGFFVPTSLKGKTVLVTGVLSVEELSEEEARHYAEDAGKSKEHIAAIKGTQKEYGIEATTVEVQ